jgi:formylglycine-generating enzyme required for sulfatase activity
MILRALRASAVGSEEPRSRGERGDNGSGSQGSSNRVNRGGSFDNPASNARSANRNNDSPSNADDNLGARPAKASQCPIAALHRTAAPRP